MAPFDQIIVGDFETAWGRQVKLGFSCQTMEEYLRDPRFKAWGMSWVRVNADDAPWGPGDPVEAVEWVGETSLPEFFASIDWTRTAFVAQNAAFDAAILAWHYGVKPSFIFDTLSMGRALRGVEAGNSLKLLAQAYGLPPKGDGLSPSENILDVLPPHVESVLIDYCKHDSWLAKQLFLHMVGHFPTSELRLIDMTIRMYTEPALLLDKDMLVDAIHEERQQREGLLQRLGVDEAALASNDQFAKLLQSLGVEPPTKTSPTTGKRTFAFSKKDTHFQSLVNDDREEIALLCETRLKVKSTIDRTRAQRFYDIATRGALPVPLTYFGAGTGRWTAQKGSSINMQNLKRGSFLRKAIMAPDGYELAVGDLSQIEPRVLAWLADYHDLLEIFRSGEDAYAQFGAQMFNIPGLSKETHPVERQAAKSALLGCGYGLGWVSFAVQLLAGFQGAKPVRYTKDFCKTLGVTAGEAEKFLSWEVNIAKLESIPHTCTARELIFHCLATKAIIDKYRALAHPIVSFWAMCDELIEKALYGGREYTHKCLTFRKEQIILPSGMPINYPNLRREYDKKQERTQWVYDGKRGKPETLYGGKVTNNVTQGSARCVMTDGMLRTAKRHPVKGTVHDEQIVLIPKGSGETELPWMIEQMTKEPPYMPGIPLAAEGGVHQRYGLAKQ